MCFTHSDIVQNKIVNPELFFGPQNYYMFVLCIVWLNVKCKQLLCTPMFLSQCRNYSFSQRSF